MRNISFVAALCLVLAGSLSLRAQMSQGGGGMSGGGMSGGGMSGAKAAANPADAANPLSADARSSYKSIEDILIKSAAEMPDDKYSFRTTPQVRTYGEMINHISDVQMQLCSLVKGEQKKADTAGKTSKADISAVLKATFDYCDPVYAGMTDAQGMQTMKMFGNNESKLGVLFFNVTHDNEMYGQMVAYLRINGFVPPSSQGRM